MPTIQFETTACQGQLQIPKVYPEWQNQSVKVILRKSDNPRTVKPTPTLLQQIRDLRQTLGPLPDSTPLIRQGRDHGW
jgi:hypothetical protein